jgi:hypothetical protein
MPTKNPRLSVVLTPALAATLAALSEATGESASSLVRDLLSQTEPALQRMLQLVTAAKAAKGQIGDGLSESMRRVVDDLQDAVAVAQARQDRVVADLVQAAEAVPIRRRARGTGGVAARVAGAAAAVQTPGAVTRGSGTPESYKLPAKRGHRGPV